MDAPSIIHVTPMSTDSSPLSSPASEISEDAPRPRRYTKRTTDRLSVGDKLREMVSTLRRLNWSFRDFVYAWAGAEGSVRDVEINHHVYRTVRQRRRVLEDTMDTLQSRGIYQPNLVPEAIGEAFIVELQALSKQRYFDLFDHNAIEDIDFSDALRVIQEKAPTWSTFILRLLMNQRAHRASYPDPSEAVSRRLYTITSIVCHSRAMKQSNFLASALALYLIGSGVKRRVVETLSGLGICYSYQQANRMMNQIAQESMKRLKELAADPQMTIVYDNMNFKDYKRDEIVGHKATMRAMTTAALVLCPELPPSGLRQSMHNPMIPLMVTDIFNAPAISGVDDGIGLEITRSLIADAIKRVHADGVNMVFKHGSYPQMPNINCLKANKTQFWQLGAIFEDEGTIQGTYGVHTSIFIDQLGLRAPDDPKKSQALHADDFRDDFRDRLFLVHGDQLTAHHIRSVKAEQSRATRPFDRRDWLLGIPAWFHIQMNLLNTIIRTHWGPTSTGEAAHHCLQADITTWGRSSYSRDNAKYHQMEPIVAQSFTSRVLALFYAAMRCKGYPLESPDTGAFEQGYISTMIARLTPNQFVELIEDVRLAAFTLDAWHGNKHTDVEFRTMCRMLQEIELFLTVRHAIKYADIGLLRYLVDPLIIFFFGASQNNYGNEMLFYRWNLSSVNTPELQHAILASGLVNWHGRATTHKAIDLGLEHLNGSCKIEMKCYKNSTHDVDIIFNRVCLSNTWVRLLRAKLEESFGEDMSGAHTTASAQLDMFLVARTLLVGDLARPRSPEELASFTKAFDSFDILQIGMAKLEEKVNNFNQHHVRHSNGGPCLPYDPNDLDSGFAAIDEYTNNITEELDGVLDPTVDLNAASLDTFDLPL